MPIVTSTPIVEPPSEFEPLVYVWTGWDGSIWPLTNRTAKVRKLRGATGFGFAPVTHWYVDSPGKPGSTYTGTHEDRGELFLPLLVQGDDSLDFLAQHAAIGRTFDPTRLGRLTVTRPDGQTRYADCRYRDGFDTAVVVDPVAAHTERYGVSWDRPDPHWSGTDVVAGPFTASELTGKTVDNIGDVPVGALWTISFTTPASGNEPIIGVGIAGSTLKFTLPLNTTSTITADLRGDPFPIVNQAGVDWYDRISDLVFAEIPPGSAIPLTMTLGGSITSLAITLRFTPKYRAAF